LRARKYTKKIEIWQIADVADGYGGNTISETLITSSWANVKTLNNLRDTQRVGELGISDPNSTIIVSLRYRNDIEYNAVNQFLKYGGDKYIIKNAPTNKNLEGTEVEIIAVREATSSVTTLAPI
jgi:head-tail adaptor